MISGSHGPVQPSPVNITEDGSSVTWNGRMIVAIRTTKSAFLPGKRKRANPYATRIDDSTAPIVLSSEIATVFRSSFGKSSWFQAVVKLSTSGANVQACWSVRHRPCQVNGVAVGSLGSTAMLD